MFVALAADTANQLKRVEKISILAPLILLVKGLKALFNPTEMTMEAVTAPRYPLSISC